MSYEEKVKLAQQLEKAELEMEQELFAFFERERLNVLKAMRELDNDEN